MSDYTKLTNYAVKDGYTSGTPAKVVKGTELDDEFNAIATAIATKLDNTDLVDILAAAYPIGSIYINASNASNPSSLLGFGTWSAFAAGRVLVGLNATDPLFDSVEETGGSKDAVVVAHTHTGSTSSAGTHNHNVMSWVGTSGLANGNWYSGEISIAAGERTTTDAGSHNHTVTVDSTGVSGTNANLQPYITVYMWKRIA